MAGLSTSLARQFGLTRSDGRQVIRSLDELVDVPNAHALRRAWERIGLSAILFVDGKPTAFFKELQHFRESDLKRYHRFVWNQGIATLLIVTTATEVFVFSGQSPPAGDGDDIAGNHRLVEQLHLVNDALEVERLIYRIETGQLYKSKPDSFDRDHAVDQYLLRNLGETAVQLHKVNRKLSLSRIHSLLGRTIFVCYLVDREVIGKDVFADAGAENTSTLAEMFRNLPAEQAITSLYRLFAMLQSKFNGSLFDENLAEEEGKISAAHVECLKRFLNGDDLGSGQMSLGFWAYDFNFIPIETISSIYEEFLGVEEQAGRTSAETTQRKSGAYYTPKHLAELVLDTAMEGRTDIINTKTLDPACGSGIFLVSMFNRMAEQWRTENSNRRSNARWQALVEILQSRLYGIDKNETACRIACFSLYLALLDQFSPRDIRELAENGKLLPPLLLKADELPSESKHRTIICRNFFADDLPEDLSDFDLVIGNPPWIGRNQPADPVADLWYRDEVKQALPSRQVAHAFMWKCPQHVGADGQVCLVLPSKVFLNRTDEFQRKWFKHHRVDEVLQLADLRFILFENAICPAVVVRYGISALTTSNYSFSYICPQASRNDPRRGVVEITSSDRRRIFSNAVSHFAEHQMAPTLWKMNLRGSPRDLRLLDRLLSYPSLNTLVGSAKSDKRFKSGQGVQPDEAGNTLKPGSKNKPKYPWWDEKQLFVDAKHEIDFALLPEECKEIGKRHNQYYRVRDRAIFASPLILISQGFTKIAFCDFDVLFQHALQSITGKRADRDLLIFLSMYLRSRLASYFLFHTAANWGTERDKVQKYELLRIPFFLPDHELAPSNASQIVKQVCSIFEKSAAKLSGDGLKDRDSIILQADQKIEPLIFEYFDCDEYEQVLVRDTCEVIEPSSTPTSLDVDIPTLRQPTTDQRQLYNEILSSVLNSWGEGSPIAVSARSLASPTTGLGIVLLSQHLRGQDKRPGPSDESADDAVIAQLDALKGQLKRENGMRTYMRGVTVFDGKTAYLVKPLSLRFWTETAALNDADSLAAVILKSKRKSQV